MRYLCDYNTGEYFKSDCGLMWPVAHHDIPENESIFGIENAETCPLNVTKDRALQILAITVDELVGQVTSNTPLREIVLFSPKAEEARLYLEDANNTPVMLTAEQAVTGSGINESLTLLSQKVLALAGASDVLSGRLAGRRRVFRDSLPAVQTKEEVQALLDQTISSVISDIQSVASQIPQIN